MNKKILVTGGAGYIGSHAVLNLLLQGYEVVVVDNLFRGYKQVVEELQKRFGEDKLKFYQVDLKDSSAINEILRTEKPVAVMHFAALCLVNESMERPEMYFENNIGGTLNLLKAMVENEVKNLVFSSTCAVYGESQYLPVDELHPTAPTNPYGESKLLSEKMIKWFGKIHGINYAIFRYFNVSGAADDGSIGDSKKPSQLLMQNAVRGALGIQQFELTCPRVETPDKTPIRDYINVNDLVEAHVMAVPKLGVEIKEEVFNLGTGKGNSVMEIITEVKKATGVDFPINSGETRKGEYAQIYANNSKAKRILRWEPKRSLKQSVESLVMWYKGHTTGWDY